MNRRVSSKKHVEKGGAKRETEDHMWCQHLATNPGPNHTHTHPSLHSSHHKSCFPLAVALTLSLLLLFLAFRQEVNGLCDVKQAHKSGTPFLVPTFFLQPPLSSCHFASLLPLWCCDERGCTIHATNESK